MFSWLFPDICSMSFFIRVQYGFLCNLPNISTERSWHDPILVYWVKLKCCLFAPKYRAGCLLHCVVICTAFQIFQILPSWATFSEFQGMYWNKYFNCNRILNDWQLLLHHITVSSVTVPFSTKAAVLKT